MEIVSVDIETTGLDPTRHETWEIAVVPVGKKAVPRCYHLPITLVGAERRALKVGNFEGRYLDPAPGTAEHRWPAEGHRPEPLGEVIGWLHETLTDTQLMGCSVHFDASFLAELFRRHGLAPEPWHHRHLDLGSFAAGAWDAKHALSSKAMSDRIPNNRAHDAYADAIWNAVVYDRIVGNP